MRARTTSAVNLPSLIVDSFRSRGRSPARSYDITTLTSSLVLACEPRKTFVEVDDHQLPSTVSSCAQYHLFFEADIKFATLPFCSRTERRLWEVHPTAQPFLLLSLSHQDSRRMFVPRTMNVTSMCGCPREQHRKLSYSGCRWPTSTMVAIKSIVGLPGPE